MSLLGDPKVLIREYDRGMIDARLLSLWHISSSLLVALSAIGRDAVLISRRACQDVSRYLQYMPDGTACLYDVVHIQEKCSSSIPGVYRSSPSMAT